MAKEKPHVYDTENYFDIIWIPFKMEAGQVVSKDSQTESCELSRVRGLAPRVVQDGIVYIGHLPPYVIHHGNPEHLGNKALTNPFSSFYYELKDQIIYDGPDVLLLNPEEEALEDSVTEEPAEPVEPAELVEPVDLASPAEQQRERVIEVVEEPVDLAIPGDLEEGELADGAETSGARDRWLSSCPISVLCDRTSHVRRHVLQGHLPGWFAPMLYCFGCEKSFNTLSRVQRHSCVYKELYSPRLDSAYARSIVELVHIISRLSRTSVRALSQNSPRLPRRVDHTDDRQFVGVVGEREGTLYAKFAYWRTMVPLLRHVPMAYLDQITGARFLRRR